MSRRILNDGGVPPIKRSRIKYEDPQDRPNWSSSSFQAPVPASASSKFPPQLNPYTNLPYTQRYYELLDERNDLPINNNRLQFEKLLDDNQCIVVQSETGSGKTTQIPQWCVEYACKHGFPSVVCTQPRRMAAISVAHRVAAEMDVKLGEQVGYSVRFDNCCSSETLLTYMTDGMLLQQLLSDPELHAYQFIIIDEAHERTVASDLLMGILKDILQERRDLKIVIMSATSNAAMFQRFFNQAPLLEIRGRNHPVTIYYTREPQQDYLESAIRTVFQIHMLERIPGDILLFLTGREEIEEARDRIEREKRSLEPKDGELNCVVLYSSLPNDQQQRIFQPTRQSEDPHVINRKVIISTNIAETSLTIDGVVFVIDPGLAKIKIYDSMTRKESLSIVPISRASADQRAGRAGRTEPGKCFRLYPEEAYHNEMLPQMYPEILRTELESVVLQLKKLGIIDLTRFNFVDSPAPEALYSAVTFLIDLGALNSRGNLTKLGNLIGELPVDPQLAKTLIVSADADCLREVLSITAMLSAGECYLYPPNNREGAEKERKKFGHDTGDHLTLLNVYNAFVRNGQNYSWCRNNFLRHNCLRDAVRIRNQLEDILRKLKVFRGNQNSRVSSRRDISIRKAFLQGFFTQVASLQDSDTYKIINNNQIVQLHPSSRFDYTQKPKYVMYDKVVTTTKTYIRTITAVDYDWILEVAPASGNVQQLFKSTVANEVENNQMPREAAFESGDGTLEALQLKRFPSFFIERNVKSRKKSWIQPPIPDEVRSSEGRKPIVSFVPTRPQGAEGRITKCPMFAKLQQCFWGRKCPFTHGEGEAFLGEDDVWQILWDTGARETSEGCSNALKKGSIAILQTSVTSSNLDWKRISWEHKNCYDTTIGQEVEMVRIFKQGDFVIRDKSKGDEEPKKLQVKREDEGTEQRESGADDAGINASAAGTSRGAQRGQNNTGRAVRRKAACPFCTHYNGMYEHDVNAFIKHLMQIHRVPILYYDEPLLLKPVIFSEDSRRDLKYQCVVRYMYNTSQYFFLEIRKHGTTLTASLFDIDFESFSNPHVYHFYNTDEVKPESWKKSISIDYFWSNDKISAALTAINQVNTYRLAIMEPTEVIASNFELKSHRAGCAICCGPHGLRACPHRSLFNESLGLPSPTKQGKTEWEKSREEKEKNAALVRRQNERKQENQRYYCGDSSGVSKKPRMWKTMGLLWSTELMKHNSKMNSTPCYARYQTAEVINLAN